MFNFFILIISVACLIYGFSYDAKQRKKIDCKLEPNGKYKKSELVKAVTKRTMSSNNGHSSRYFVTFELDANKKRIEFEVAGKTYGMIVECDEGKLVFQGDKFIKFDRIIE